MRVGGRFLRGPPLFTLTSA